MSNILTDPERAYFQARAEQQILLAQDARHEKAVRAHYLLAGYYLDRAHGECPDKPPSPILAPRLREPA